MLSYPGGCQLYAQQSGKRIVEQFKFTKIDSLINDAVINGLDTGELIVVSCKWNIGARTSKRKKFESIDNPFNIIIYYIGKEETIIRKIDNYSVFHRKKVPTKRVKELSSFINTHLNEMQDEPFNEWVDNIEYDADSNKLISRIRSRSSHKMLQTVIIKNGDSTLQFQYSKDYDINPENLTKYKYLFVTLITDNERKISNRIWKRKDIKYK